MKTDIHPELVECVITCVCGAVHKTLGIQPQMRVDICGKCHPFYTGQQVFVDTAGRVDKFQQRLAKTKAAQEKAAAFKKKRR